MACSGKREAGKPSELRLGEPGGGADSREVAPFEAGQVIRDHALRARSLTSSVDKSYRAASAAYLGDVGVSRSSSARVCARQVSSAESSSRVKSSLLPSMPVSLARAVDRPAAAVSRGRIGEPPATAGRVTTIPGGTYSLQYFTPNSRVKIPS